MIHRAADLPGRPDVPRRATDLALRRRRLVEFLLAGRERLDGCRLLHAPCLSRRCGRRLRLRLPVCLSGRCGQVSTGQAARHRPGGRRLRGLATGHRRNRGALGDTRSGRRSGLRNPSLSLPRGRRDRGAALRRRGGGLACPGKLLRRLRLCASDAGAPVTAAGGLVPAPARNRNRDAGQLAETEHADTEADEPETGEGARRDRGLAEAARPGVVLGHEDGPLGSRTCCRKRRSGFCLDRGRRHSDVLLPSPRKMPDWRRVEALNHQVLQNVYSRYASFRRRRCVAPRLAPCLKPLF